MEGKQEKQQGNYPHTPSRDSRDLSLYFEQVNIESEEKAAILCQKKSVCVCHFLYCTCEKEAHRDLHRKDRRMTNAVHFCGAIECTLLLLHSSLWGSWAFFLSRIKIAFVQPMLLLEKKSFAHRKTCFFIVLVEDKSACSTQEKTHTYWGHQVQDTKRRGNEGRHPAFFNAWKVQQCILARESEKVAVFSVFSGGLWHF